MSNYIRLNYSTERELSDYMINSSSLSAEETRDLIAAKKTEVITDVYDNETDYKIYYNSYNWVPVWIMEQLYEEIAAMPKLGVIKAFLDHETFGHLLMVKLLVGTLEAYRIQDYKEEIEAGTGEDVILQPKALSRTENSKSIGDMSIGFESERLGIKIDTPFEQYLSTIPTGIEIIEAYKNYKSSLPTMGIV